MNGIMENSFVALGKSNAPWHGIGASLGSALAPDEAIKKAQLDWEVEQTPIYAAGNPAAPIPGYVANVRGDTKETLGIVSKRYRVAQNKDVFAFAEELIGSSEIPCSYETAGALFNGRRVFLLVNMPKGRIVEDEYKPYVCLSNSHDGSSCLQAFLTAIRVSCSNTLTIALKTALRKISIRHVAAMEQRKGEAARAMGAASKYFQGIEAFATELEGKKVSIGKVLGALFPASGGMTQRQLSVNRETKQMIESLLHRKDDLQNFKGTAWGAYSAIADYRSNAQPKRRTAAHAGRKMAMFLDGDPVLIQAQEIIMELAA